MSKWALKNWSDVLTIINGKNQKYVVDNNGQYPIYGSGGIMAYANAYLCNENTTVIGRKGTINNPIYVETKFWNVDTAFGISAGENLNPKFLHYFCLGYDFTKHNKSTTLPSLTKKDLLQIEIPLPSLPEQKRIVAKLDGLFEKIDKAIALLEENIAHTQSLMASVLDEIYSNGDKNLKDLCTPNPKKSEVKDFDNEMSVSFLPMKDLKEHDIDFEITEERKLGEVYKGYTYFRDGDVILAKVTPCFENGKAGVAKNLTNGIGFGSSEYHVLRAKKGVMPEWIYYGVLAEQFRVTGKENMTGSGGLKRVPIKFVENWKMPFPDFAIQQKEVDRIRDIQNYIRQFQNEINLKLHNLRAVKSSLLDKAFKGEL